MTAPDNKQHDLEQLLDELSGRLADFLARAEKRDAEHQDTAESVATALADLVKVLQKLKPADLSPLVHLLRGLELKPSFNVHPSPVQFLPAPEYDATYEIRIASSVPGQPDRVATITKTVSAKR